MRRFSAFVESKYVLPAILLIGAALRMRYLGTSLCLDDWAALRDSVHIYPSSVEKFRPLFFSLLYGWRCLGPDTDWWLQLLPFLLSLACIPLAWLVGMKLGGRRIAAALALLLAVSQTHLDLTAEVRIYALLSLFGLLQLLCFLELRERPRIGVLAANSLLGAAALYTQPMYSLFLFGLFVLSLLDRRQFPVKSYFISLVGMAVLYLPNLFVILEYARHVQGAATMFTTHPWGAPFKLVAAYTTGFTFFRVNDLGLGAKIGFREIAANAPFALLWMVTFGLIVVGAVRRLRDPHERFVRHAILVLLILPFAIAYSGVLITHRNLTHAPFHIASLPLALLLVIKGIQGLGTKRVLQSIALVCYTLIVGLTLYRFNFDAQHFGRRSDWHHAARYLEQHTRPDAPLLVFLETPERVCDYPYLMRYAFDTRSAWQSIAAPVDTMTAANYTQYLRERLAGYRTVYYLWEAQKKDLLDPHNTVLKAMQPLAAEESVEIINPRLAIYRWQLRNSAKAG